jgi:hypothetical protein
MISDWKFLTNPESVPIADHDDAVIHLQLGDAVVADKNQGLGNFHAFNLHQYSQACSRREGDDHINWYCNCSIQRFACSIF